MTKAQMAIGGKAWRLIESELRYDSTSISDMNTIAQGALRPDGSFLSGFVPLIVDRARKSNMRVEWKDDRTRPEVTIDPSFGPHLRDYQRDAVTAALSRGRGVIVAPTGAGKTVIASEIMRKVDTRWLFLAHRKELVEQTKASAKRFAGIEAGDLNSGARVVVTTFQTFYRRMIDGDFEPDIEKFGGLIVDEAHVLPATTFLDSIMSVDAYYRLGLTGTPYGRSDGRSLFVIGGCGPVIYQIAPTMLIDAGKLAKPRIQAVVCRQDYKMRFHQDQKSRGAEWRKAEKILITESFTRNKLVMKLVAASKKPCMVFVAKRAHGDLLLKACHQMRIKAEWAHGGKNQTSRKLSIDRLGEGDIEVLICSTIFDEGIDIPAVATVILAGGGKSAIKNVQRVGRGMRLAEGKDTVDVYDIHDVGCATLKNHSDARKKAFIECGYEVDVVEAPL